MLHVMGQREHLETLLLLVRPDTADQMPTWQSVRSGYQELLSKLQPDVPMATAPEVRYVVDGDDHARLMAVLNTSGNWDPTVSHHRLESDSAVYRDAAFKREVQRLCSDNPAFENVFPLAVHTLFFAQGKTAFGGSTSAAIGVIWCRGGDDWTPRDYEEFLYHELTHNLMFIDNLRRAHFVDTRGLANPANFSTSAIQHRMRPLDKVTHSVMVAAEVLLLRERRGSHGASKLHPASDALRGQALRAIDELLAKHAGAGVISARSCELMNHCRALIASPGQQTERAA